MVEKMSSVVSRVFFFGASVLLVIAILERISNVFGYTFLRRTYTAGRLLELSVILIVFIVALLLREIREELKLARRA